MEDWGPWEEFRRVNVDGTRAVLDACRRAGVRRFVHVGTEAAVLRGQDLRHADETVPLAFDSPAPYSSTKALAEWAVLAAAARGFDTMVVRPRFVWGRGDTTLLPRLVALARQGRLAWIGGGSHHTSTTHVDNTVHALLLAAERGRARRRLVRHGRHARRVPRVRVRAAAHPGRRAARRASCPCRSPAPRWRPARRRSAGCRCAARRR